MSIELGTTLKETANAGVRMPLRRMGTGPELADGDGNVAALYVLGADSDVARQCERDFQKTLDEHSKRHRSGAVPPELWEEHRLEKAVRLTTGWEHCSYQGTTTFSAKVIRDFYRNEPWALEQVERFVTDREHFAGA